MFNWFKKKVVPATPAIPQARPSRDIRVSLPLANGDKTRTEQVDLLACLEEVLRLGGFGVSAGESSLQLESGLVVQPGFAGFQPAQRGGVQTVTTVEVSCPPRIPAGVFEFQHSTGDDSRQSIAKGFEGWMQLDLPVFLEALRPKPEHCACMEFDLPAEGVTPPQKRRVVLGPVAHLVSRQTEGPAEEHPFCPCCLFTNSATAMMPKIRDGRFYGARLFAMRDQDGSVGADCRLNGEDWEPGKKALIEYAKTWPDRGIEFRKQYVIIQTVPSA
jgi:hypothetical protein